MVYSALSELRFTDDPVQATLDHSSVTPLVLSNGKAKRAKTAARAGLLMGAKCHNKQHTRLEVLVTLQVEMNGGKSQPNVSGSRMDTLGRVNHTECYIA